MGSSWALSTPAYLGFHPRPSKLSPVSLVITTTALYQFLITAATNYYSGQETDRMQW